MHWLIKSEPDVFSIEDLKKVKQEPWTGVRNYQARNFMWHEMQPGELAIFYHSNAKPSGAAGVAKVASEPYPDPTQFDPKATEDKPRWWLVDFQHVATFKEMIPLEAMKADAALAEMMVCQKGTRLSINPVEKKHFNRVLKIAKVKI
ncbi:MAG: EVE domain-containing protein [Akkermansiaceae bacterium]